MEAKNKSGEKFFDAKKLAKRLQKALGDDDSDTPSLREISSDFIPNKRHLLNETLQPLMITTQISVDQAYIIKQPWRRVYTTNYDDVFEFGVLEARQKYNNSSFDSPVTKNKNGVQIIHLHGNIHDCTNENIDEKLVLTEGSYVRQLARPRPWFDEFTDDARFSQTIIFLGYSLSDTPITALLLSSPEMEKKTSFVVRSRPSGRYERNLSRYGKIRPIALSGFADHLKSRSSDSRRALRPTKLSAFTEMNVKKDGKPLKHATSVEVRNLLTYGTFNYLASAASWPETDYLVPRKNLVEEAIASVGTSKTVLIHSRTSNGKSLLSEIISIAMSERGWRCIRSKATPNLSDDDLAILKSTQRLVLFFKNSDDAIYTLKQLGPPRNDMRFVIEVSTSIADVRANAFGAKLKQPIARINANTFTKQDKDDLELILDKAGIRSKDFPETSKKCNELRDFLLLLYENEKIRENLLTHARPLWELPPVRRAMTTVFSLKVLGLDVSPTLKREIIGEDPLSILDAVPDDLRSNVLDLFDFNDSTVEPFSTVVSQFLLSKFLVAQDLLDWALSVAIITSKRKQEQLSNDQRGPRFHESTMALGRVLQHSRLNDLVSEMPDSDKKIVNMFEKARNYPEINLEPLFWLQFSIASDSENATIAQLTHCLEYLETGYRRAEDIENFKTFQLDTHHLRLLLRIESHSDISTTDFDHWDNIEILLANFARMLSDESHRGFALRVLELVEFFVDRRINDMDQNKKRGLAELLFDIAEALGLFDEQTKHRYLSEGVRNSILRSANRLDASLRAM